MTKKGMNRLVHYSKISEDPKVNEETFALIVRELTGEWILPVKCEMIQNEKRFFYDEVVYFGPVDELKEGGRAHKLNEASMVDKFKFDLQRNGFFYNEDPECRKARDLEEDKSYIVWYNGENSIPYIIEIGEEPIEVHRILYETTIRTVLGSPMWGQRANSALFDFYQNGLVYMMPEMIETDKMVDDWRIMLSVGMIELMQENDTSFVPIVVPFEQPEDHILMP